MGEREVGDRKGRESEKELGKEGIREAFSLLTLCGSTESGAPTGAEGVAVATEASARTSFSTLPPHSTPSGALLVPS